MPARLCWRWIGCVLSLMLGLAPTPLLAHGGDEDGLAEIPPIRVGLVEGVSKVACGITGGGGWLIDPVSGKRLKQFDADDEYEFFLKDDTIKGAGGRAKAVRIEPESPTAHVTYAGRVYRGALELHLWEGGLVVVNYCTLDEYLYGVVPREMPSGWPLEALKAQAVAARTYAVKNLGQFEHGLYDLKPTTADQVYEGFAAEKARANEAIDVTSGLILTYEGAPIQAYFHAAAGTSTIAGSGMRGEKSRLPYLQAVPSHEADLREWELLISVGELSGSLSRLGYKVGKLIAIGPDPHDSGMILAEGTEASKSIPRNTLRYALGSGRFRSANFDIAIEGKSKRGKPLGEDVRIHFKGSGWGHNVGLSQWGAKGYAEAEGWDYRQILGHFYPGTTLSFYYHIS